MAKIKKVIQLTTRNGQQFSVLYESGHKVVYGFIAMPPLTVIRFLEDDKTKLEKTTHVQRRDGEVVRYDYYVKGELSSEMKAYAFYDNGKITMLDER